MTTETAGKLAKQLVDSAFEWAEERKRLQGRIAELEALKTPTQPKPGKAKHWYSLTFAYYENGGLCMAVGTVNVNVPMVNPHCVEQTREYLGLPDALLTNVSYLGQMTQEQWESTK